ncbi:Do family serine endopeptidase [Rheinheimera sp. YQF-2]|uniref:Do family serine endopeptidase n=1 Tax=Rheinheimera lutimaris TaxID=2740584 RepID=A0A7Y5EJH8_9GAMM|nr:Do family serine endopeptidase [Rheinheimera lutimaris]NRQ43381.1 Do family serine endopeptidase [Rheinheimera lutimaris]
MNKKLSLLGAAVTASLLLTTATPADARIPFFSSEQEIPTLAPMLEQATPSVVHISVEGSREVRQRLPEAFRYFFGQRGPNEYREERPFKGLGSGVVIDAAKGYIVTNNHVIQDANDIEVRLKDGRTFKAKKLGADPESDIALLQIEAENLIQIPLANSDKTRVGDFAVAIGNPFGLEQTVTSGIISALGRGGLGIEGLEDFIQTDAAINSGNSGGALVNLRGELIGINTAILGPNGGNIGIGFAIPANMMKNLVDQIVEYGEIRRGSLGIRGGDVNADLTEAMNLSVSRGAFVNEVLPDSAAEEAGLKSGDVIISMNGNKINSFIELRAKVGTLGAGREAKLGILRDGKERTVTVKLQELASGQVAANQMHPMLDGAELTNTDGGVKVEAVSNNSAAAQIGLLPDDIIVGVNRQRVTNLAELRKALENRSGVAALNIQRGNTNLYVLIR